MPLIKKEQFNYLNKRFNIAINFSSKTNKFYADLPDDFKIHQNDRRLEHKTYEGLRSSIVDYIGKYYAKDEIKEKYIYYRILAQHPSVGGIKVRKDIQAFDPASIVGFTLQCEVIDATRIGDTIVLHRNNSTYKPSDLKGKLIKYSEQRLKAMTSINNKLVDTIMKILLLETLSTEDIEKFLDEGKEIL